MKKYFYIFSIIFFLSNCAETQKESTQDPSVQTFTGTITKERFWGPPNYGEDTLTDKKEIVPVINLDVVMRVAPDSTRNATEQWVKKLQVVTTKNLDEFLNKNVTIKGKMFEAQTGHHHTDYLLDLTEISASR